MTAQAASALAYSYLKRYEFSPKTQRVACILDMGHSGITITFGIFLQKIMDVYLTRTNRNLGGRDMDKILMKFIVDKFKKENDISADICNGPKYAKHRIKMLPIIEKARKNLTTNSEVDV